MLTHYENSHHTTHCKKYYKKIGENRTVSGFCSKFNMGQAPY